MLVAMLRVQTRYGFSSINTIGLNADGPLFGPPGYEINLLYIAALVAIAVAGPGPMSIANWMASRRSGRLTR
jgi:putative oxidoreductase